MACGEDMEYQREAPACPATCLNPTASLYCDFPATEACVCPEGKMLEDGKCIDPVKCGCIDINDVRYEVREQTNYVVST